MRKIEVLIVVVALAVIVALVFGAVGCKDKTEAMLRPIDKPEVEYIDCPKHGKSEYMRYHDGFKECYYCKLCYGEFLRKNMGEIIRDTDLVKGWDEAEAVEPNSIIWFEPNEPHLLTLYLTDDPTGLAIRNTANRTFYIEDSNGWPPAYIRFTDECGVEIKYVPKVYVPESSIKIIAPGWEVVSESGEWTEPNEP